jgi:hypothetical protein
MSATAMISSTHVTCVHNSAPDSERKRYQNAIPTSVNEIVLVSNMTAF